MLLVSGGDGLKACNMEEYFGTEMYRFHIVKIWRNNGAWRYTCELNPFVHAQSDSFADIKNQIDDYWDNFVVFSRRT